MRIPVGAPSPGVLLPAHLRQELKYMNLRELSELLCDLEVCTRENSEILVQELARRDELTFEKELRNTFISLLVSIHSRKQQLVVDKKGTAAGSKHLTTVIPYDATPGSLTLPTIQVLNRILKAIADDNPTVPTLLTDYILKDTVGGSWFFAHRLEHNGLQSGEALTSNRPNALVS
ncbi:unnamed protein product [Cyprideis torosa]|uniref:Uncharacterized protein n=1 Tax=Cyprideis torosa TaxID=163714 RepID=A0A7R8W248_9CRUS|nr:unnamed protein product [Cyprideis torosa]CAG0880595.1 unnamed protein product [Cyprideis torosa]